MSRYVLLAERLREAEAQRDRAVAALREIAALTVDEHYSQDIASATLAELDDDPVAGK